MVRLGGFQALTDQVDVVLGRLDAPLGLLLEGVQHVDGGSEPDGAGQFGRGTAQIRSCPAPCPETPGSPSGWTLSSGGVFRGGAVEPCLNYE